MPNIRQSKRIEKLVDWEHPDWSSRYGLSWSVLFLYLFTRLLSVKTVKRNLP
jgi:hypothetical protein